MHTVPREHGEGYLESLGEYGGKNILRRCQGRDGALKR